MFRIRRVFDDTLPLDRREIEQVQGILRTRFAGVREKEIASLPLKLCNPLKYKFRHILLVADDLQRQVHGFALMSHEPELHFSYLDYLASSKALTGSGVGGALYQRVRDEARRLSAAGLFFECSPDDPAEVDDPQTLKDNIARLRFYERYGARPIVHNEYQLPVRAGDRGMPFLMFDGLGREGTPRRNEIRAIVQAVLERKYDYLCPQEYIERVVQSFQDEPIQLRPFRYRKPAVIAPPPPTRPADAMISLIVNEQHDIHHVRERGYVEAPVRIRAILEELNPMGLFRPEQPRGYPESKIKAVHDGQFVEYLKRMCDSMPPGKSLYPYVFPIRNATRPPKELSVLAGYYCIDTFTPLNRNAYLAAKRAVDCALTGADIVLGGQRLAYALVRPPGHHAERRAFGGFCYFNSGAIAAQHLSGQGRVVVLDIDYHHGNGTQEIFYERSDVLTISIHGHPRFAYPYFSGFEEERGSGAGAGFNVNYALPEQLDGSRYREVLQQALTRISRFKPQFLVLALGLDTAKGDPTGTWTLGPADFEANGRLIGGLGLPTLVVQEGGYRTRTLGVNARHFFKGLADTLFAFKAGLNHAVKNGARPANANKERPAGEPGSAK